MAEKFIEIGTGGVLQENEGQVTSAGVADAGKIVALDASGKLDATLLPTGQGADAQSIPASETMTGPALVNVWNDTGTLKARYADASAANASKRAVGFILTSVTAPAAVTVYFEGIMSGLAALTPGATLFLSGTVPGGVTATAPVTSGHAVQEVGVALGATSLAFEADAPIIRA